MRLAGIPLKKWKTPQGWHGWNAWAKLPDGRWVDIYYYGRGYNSREGTVSLYFHNAFNSRSYQTATGPLTPLVAQCQLYELLKEA